MISLYSAAALIVMGVTAFARQITLFTAKTPKGLWWFVNFPAKRRAAISITLALVLLAILAGPSTGDYVFFALIAGCALFARFIDPISFFPVIRSLAHTPLSESPWAPDTRVLGVTVNGESMAYPLDEALIPRHLIHDTIAGVPLLMSYCALCRSALAFEARVDGKPLTFMVVGVWRRNMIIEDHETHSTWQQSTGECIRGPLAGKQLPLVSGENTTLSAWADKHLNTSVATDFVEEGGGVMSKSTMLWFLGFFSGHTVMPGHTDLTGLSPVEQVFGISLNGDDQAYPAAALQTLPTFTDTVGGEQLTLSYDKVANMLSAYRQNGEEVLVQSHLWLGWKEFHPNTRIFKTTRSAS